MTRGDESQISRSDAAYANAPKRWIKRNYQTATFINSQAYRTQDAVAVFQVGLHAQPLVQPSCQHVHPILVSNECEEDEELKEECVRLQARIKELESKPAQVQIVKEFVEVEDKTKVNQLELENQKLRLLLNTEQDKNRYQPTISSRLREQECSDLRYKLGQLEQGYQNEISTLKNQLLDYEKKINYLVSELDGTKRQLREKEQEATEWRVRYEELEDQGVTVIQEKVTYLSNEIEVWKQRFIKLNKEYHEQQESYIMLQAEIDAYKKQGQSVRTVTVQEVKRSGVVKSTVVDPNTKTSDLVRKVQDSITN